MASTNYYNNSSISSNSIGDVDEWLECDVGPGGALSSAYFQALVCLAYCLVFVIALAGNGLVCYVVHSSPRMRTVTNIFIVNLAVGDVLMTLFCVPFTFVSTLLLQYWPFGAPLCHTVSFSQAVSVLVSAYTLVAISLDRYMAVLWPLRPRMGKRHAKATVAAVWLGALITAFPIPAVSSLKQPSRWHHNCDRFVCEEEWESQSMRQLYSAALMTLQYAVPLCVLVFTYTSIAVEVWGKRPPGEAQDTRDIRIARSKRKMVKMMLTVVAVFTICWLPLNILLITWQSCDWLSEWSGLPYLWFACHWLAMSHSCYNPFIYCWMNTHFRAGFCGVLGCALPRRKKRRRSSHAPPLGRVNTCATYVSVRRAPRDRSLTRIEHAI
ncbi:RYamide receptor-like [Nilaparvata lugens]|uniref:RYamide receptor-like n=1 Tax=Nilaparvata lugens TaxID=108931 RepID=UPI00193D76B6|nr:RYamide receptor-like [Nilaparvata lugens]